MKWITQDRFAPEASNLDIDTQVNGQAYSQILGKWGISVLQTSFVLLEEYFQFTFV